MTQILTYTGKAFDLALPVKDLIDPRDIAHALAHICRFNGHTRRFYSVAQHCCLVADLVPVQDKLAALLHDATEAYVGDMVRPLKQHMFAFQHIEEQVWQSICQRFHLYPMLPKSVIHADRVALATERRDLMPDHPAEWEYLVGIEPSANLIRPWGPDEARETYLQRLMTLLEYRAQGKAP